MKHLLNVWRKKNQTIKIVHKKTFYMIGRRHLQYYWANDNVSLGDNIQARSDKLSWLKSTSARTHMDVFCQ